MNFEKLYKMQYELDKSINEKHNTSYQTTINKRLLAFEVELSEFANETRCFKYWSLKDPSIKEIQLEEYVDGIHFILSLGLAINFDINYDFNCLVKDNLTNQFIYVYELASIFNQTYNPLDYIKLFEAFLGLAKLSNFSYEDILNAYYSKNQINYQRQENNY